jgi:hypothetical protein
LRRKRDATDVFFVAGVFNIFVENLVENRHSIRVSDSLRDASALCTEAGAGTFVVRFTKNFR